MKARKRFRCSITFEVEAPDGEGATFAAHAIAFETELNWPKLIVAPVRVAKDGAARVWVTEVLDMGEM